MRLYPQARAYFWSVVIHTALVVGLFSVNHRAERLQRDAERQQAVREHAPVHQRTQAETHARQLRRIRELAERLTAEHDSASRAEERDDVTAPEAGSAPRAAPKDLAELWRESRDDFEAVRERLREAEAQRLAEIQQTEVESARRQLEATAGGEERSETNGAPGTDGETAEAIAGMHGEARQMLARALEQARGEREGTPLGTEEAREAYVLTQTPQQAREVQYFDRVVDWTALMGGPLSTAPTTGAIEPDRDFRRVETGRESELRARFDASRDAMRFGRRIGPTGTEAARWICPDAWYMIGPFGNANREAMERSFPPEIEIDRDASYAGKDGRAVAWELVRVNTVQVIPPHLEEYAIYYAYTEIHSAQPMNCWLALGGDDYSKLWVNDVLVWSGAKNEKQWTPVEGFRRVRLDAGFNRFLFRLENGWREAQFSVLVSLEP